MNTKNFIRKQLKEKLSLLPNDLYNNYSNIIANFLYNETAWQSANVIGIYLSMPPEVDTRKIIMKAWHDGKTVVVPKCLPKTREMEFRKIEAFTDLESVYSGLQEPIVEKTEAYSSNQIDLQIVPGLGFTREGHRIGFGGGYYDRYLQSFQSKTIALAFDIQLLGNIPNEEHDIPVSKIITNQEVIDIQ